MENPDIVPPTNQLQTALKIHRKKAGDDKKKKALEE